MPADQAYANIVEIVADVMTTRGLPNTNKVRLWGRGYALWNPSCKSLTAEEIADAIDDGWGRAVSAA